MDFFKLLCLNYLLYGRLQTEVASAGNAHVVLLCSAVEGEFKKWGSKSWAELRVQNGGPKSGSQMGGPYGGPKWGSQMGVPNGGPKWGSQMGVPNGGP
jgi:hypothetical protein